MGCGMTVYVERVPEGKRKPHTKDGGCGERHEFITHDCLPIVHAGPAPLFDNDNELVPVGELEGYDHVAVRLRGDTGRHAWFPVPIEVARDEAQLRSYHVELWRTSP